MAKKSSALAGPRLRGWEAAPAAQLQPSRDPLQRLSHRPALDLKSATFRFSEQTYRLKVASVRKKRTPGFAPLTETREPLRIEDRFATCGMRRTGALDFNYKKDDYHRRFADGVPSVFWDWRRDSIPITVISTFVASEPHSPTYAVAKGRPSRTPKSDYIVANCGGDSHSAAAAAAAGTGRPDDPRVSRSHICLGSALAR